MKTKLLVGLVLVTFSTAWCQAQTLVIHGAVYDQFGALIDLVLGASNTGQYNAKTFDNTSTGGYVGGLFTQVTSDVSNGTAIEIYRKDPVTGAIQDTGISQLVDGATAPFANNIFWIASGVTGHFTYRLLSSGYNGSGNGVAGRVDALAKQISGSETDLAIGGIFSGAGGYTNNGRFAVYRDGYNGWADYFYYPSAAEPDSADVTILGFNGTGTINVQGMGITAVWDQYGDHPYISAATWSIPGHYFSFIH